MVQVCMAGYDDDVINSELERMTRAFAMGAASTSPPLPLTALVLQVVGIEMNASAVSDAQRNAEINGITNCKFICSKAEDVMGSLLKEYLDMPQDEDSKSTDNDEKQNGAADNGTTSVENNESDPKKGLKAENMEADHAHCSNESIDDKQNNVHSSTDSGNTKEQRFKNVVAIVDPPRSGLHPVVLKALRTHPRLKRLVYISCNPETLVANAIELCTPSSEKTEKGGNRGWRNMSSAGLARHRLKSMPMSEPFQPVKAMAVDLFPHTPHCELVMLLER